MTVGEEVRIQAQAVPSTAKKITFQWSSTDTDVVTVNAGKVYAAGEGKAEIRISFQDVSATVPVEVTSEEGGMVLRTRIDTESGCTFANAAEYGIYIPEGEDKLNAVLVLQHGCGMERFGITRPYDLQYRAFARKWRLAIVETALYGDCYVWKEPESGSAKALFDALSQAGSKTGHPELASAPLLLFGHSAGGYWTLGMLRDYPERILAAVCYSAAFDPQWDYRDETARIPVLLRHAGAEDAPTALCEQTAKNSFRKLRSMDAPASIAYNEGQNHNYSYMRYIAIPFYEAALKYRLPSDGEKSLGSIDRSKAWLGNPDTFEIFPEAGYEGDKSGLCLFPDGKTAGDWQEYVKTGTLSDKTPPEAPYDIKVSSNGNSSTVTWKAEADIESGIGKFLVYVNGTLAGTVPEEGEYQSFDLNGDNTYPVEPVGMSLTIGRKLGRNDIVEVENVNRFGLVSERGRAIQ